MVNNIEKVIDLKTSIIRSGYTLNYKDSFTTDKLFNDLLRHNGNIDDNLIAYYYSCCNKTEDLYEYFRYNKVYFKNEYSQYDLFLLDKRFTKYFTKEELLYLFKNYRSEISGFYNRLFSIKKRNISGVELSSLKDKYYGLLSSLLENYSEKKYEELISIGEKIDSSIEYKFSKDDQEKIMKEFSKIIKTNPDYLRKDKYNKYRNILSPKYISMFGSDMLLRLSDTQKDIFENNYNNNDKVLEKFKELFTKFPDYTGELFLNDDVFNTFSIDEINDVNSYEASIYNKAESEGILDRVKVLYAKGYKFDDGYSIMNKEVLTVLSDEDILTLSDKAKKKIANLINQSRSLKISNPSFRLSSAVLKVVKRDKLFQKVKKLVK